MSFRLIFACCLTMTVSTIATVDVRADGQVDLKQYRLTPKYDKDFPPFEEDRMFTDLKNGKRRTGHDGNGKDKELLEENRKMLRDMAEFFVYRITNDMYYEPDTSPTLQPREAKQTLKYVFDKYYERLFFASPSPSVNMNTDQSDFIREYGAALDQAIVNVLTNHNDVPPTVIRINAMRMLEMACRTGSPAHGKTVIKLLKNKCFKRANKDLETPPDVLYWALKCAESLLAAYHPEGILTTEEERLRHCISKEELVELIEILQDMIEKGPPIADKVALPPKIAMEEKPAQGGGGGVLQAGMTREQTAVMAYYRRQAVRALCRVRFDIIKDAQSGKEVRPALLMARIAVADKRINPSRAEIGEALIGLCGIQPSGQLNIPELLHSIAFSATLFFDQKITSPEDHSIAWKIYIERLKTALDVMKTPTQSNVHFRDYKKLVDELDNKLRETLLKPMENPSPNNRPTRDKIDQWNENNVPKERNLFKDNPDTKLEPGQPRVDNP